MDSSLIFAAYLVHIEMSKTCYIMKQSIESKFGGLEEDGETQMSDGST